MKLILNEEQYNRLFNNKKRKMIITESQYELLLLEKRAELPRKAKKAAKKAAEAEAKAKGEEVPAQETPGEETPSEGPKLSGSLSGVKEGETIKLTSGENKLHFKVISVRGDGFIMINCNKDSVYKNAYFHIVGDSLGKNKLTYSSAQNNDIKDAKNPWETIGSDIWRKSVFKNLNAFDVYKDAGEGNSCNLSDDAKKKFAIDMNTGSVVSPNNEEEPGEDEGGDEAKEFSEEGIAEEISKWKSNSAYIFQLDDGSKLNLMTGEKGAGTVPFEIKSVSGDEGDRYNELVGEQLEFEANKKNVQITNEERKVFSLNVKLYVGGEAEGGGSKSEDKPIQGISDFGEGNINLEGDEGDESVSELSDEQMEELVEKLVTNDEFLQNAIASKPNKFLELIRVSRKRGIIPAEGRLADWGVVVSDKVEKDVTAKKFPVNEEFTAKFQSWKIEDKELGSQINDRFKFKIKSLKPIQGDKYKKFGTNLTDEIKLEKTLSYTLHLIKELEDRDNFYVYKVELFYKEKGNAELKPVASGSIQILKNKEKKEDKNSEEKK